MASAITTSSKPNPIWRRLIAASAQARYAPPSPPAHHGVRFRRLQCLQLHRCGCEHAHGHNRDTNSTSRSVMPRCLTCILHLLRLFLQLPWNRPTRAWPANVKL
jgi:hypothetical protein